MTTTVQAGAFLEGAGEGRNDVRREMMPLLQMSRGYVMTMMNIYLVLNEDDKYHRAQANLAVIDATIKEIAEFLEDAN